MGFPSSPNKYFISLTITKLPLLPFDSRYLDKYYTDATNTTKEKWDFLQSRLRCCGQKAYTEYQSIVDTSNVKPKTLFPKSCCYDYGTTERHCYDTQENQPRNIIKYAYVRGCLDILSNLYQVIF